MIAKKIGTWSIINNSDIINIIGLAKYDFVIVDFEHGTHTLNNLNDHVRAAKSNNLKIFARPKENNKKEILESFRM